MSDDDITFHDLKVAVITTGRPMACNHNAGDYFPLSRSLRPCALADRYRWRRSVVGGVSR